MRRFALAAALAAVLSAPMGCGFRLADTGAPALAGIVVVYEDPYRVVPPPLVEILESRLGMPPAQPSGRLIVREVENSRRVLAVSPSDGRAAAYELVSTVRFDFRAGGETLLADRSLSVRRGYGFDDTQRLAEEAERDELTEAMHAELADLILLRLEAVVAGRAEAP